MMFWLVSSIFIAPLYCTYSSTAHTDSSILHIQQHNEVGEECANRLEGRPPGAKTPKNLRTKFYRHFIGIQLDLGPKRAGAQVHGSHLSSVSRPTVRIVVLQSENKQEVTPPEALASLSNDPILWL